LKCFQLLIQRKRGRADQLGLDTHLLGSIGQAGLGLLPIRQTGVEGHENIALLSLVIWLSAGHEQTCKENRREKIRKVTEFHESPPARSFQTRNTGGAIRL